MQLPLKLTTTVSKIRSVPNHTNSVLISDFNEYMKTIGCSEHHQNNNLKAAIAFARFLGPGTTLYEINKKEQIIAFLDTKIKVQNRTLTRSGLLLGIIIFTVSNCLCDGYITKEESK